MKNWMMVFFALQLGSAMFAKAGVNFDKAACERVMPAGFSSLCSLHEEQVRQRSFQSDAVYGFSYTSCDKFTGQIIAASSRAIPCLAYFAETESKKEIAIQSIFGNTPRYPLSYKGLYIGFIVRPKQVQMGHNSGTPQRQFGDSRVIRRFGDSQNGRSDLQMQ